MKAEEFNRKYQLNFNYQSYLTAGFRMAAQNVTITRTDERMPTPQAVKVRVDPAQALYIKYLKSYLSTVAKFRPLMGGGLVEVAKDFESVLQEENPGRPVREGIPLEFIAALAKESLALLPKDETELDENIIENGAKARRTNKAAYTRRLIGERLQEGDKGLSSAVSAWKALEKIHTRRGWRLGNLFTNIREWWTLRSAKADLERAAGGKEALEKVFLQDAEKYDFAARETEEIERAAGGSEKAKEPTNPAVPEVGKSGIEVREAEEPTAERSEVPPQKESVVQTEKNI